MLEDIATEPAPEATPAPPPPDTQRSPAVPSPAAAEERRTRAEREAKEFDDDLRAAYRNSKRERGEDGRFAGDTKKVAGPDEAPAPVLDKDAKPVTAKPVEAKVDPTKPVEPVAKPAVPAPQAWKADIAAKWATLPPEVQSYVAEREAATQRLASEHGQARAFVDEINSIYEPHAGRLRGADYREHLGNLLTADAALERDPVGFLKYVAQAKGIDINALVPDPYAVADPQAAQWEARYNASQARLEEMERRFGVVEQNVIGRQEAERRSRDEASQKLISEFAADKTDFQDLRDEIIANAGMLRQSDPNATDLEILKQAYERAQWANPKSRQAIIDRQTQDAEAKRIEAAKAQAERARRAGSINVRRSAAPVVGQVSLDDNLRSIWRKHQAS